MLYPKRFFTNALLLALVLLSVNVYSANQPIPVVLDTDIGSDIDDTWALAYLLKCPELDLKMVLCGTADTHWRGKVAAKFLEISGRSDIPVGLGPRGGSGGEYQGPWVEDYELDDYSGEVFEDGVGEFIKMVHESNVPITLIAIGPIPNIKEALKRDPSIAAKVRFVGMFGSVDIGYGGGAPVAETNVRVDVEAFKMAHRAPWQHFEITPLDTCGLLTIGGENYQKLLHSDQPILEALFDNYAIWAKLVPWMTVDFYDRRSSTLFDVVAVYMAFAHEYLEFETIPLSVDDEGFTLRDDKGIPTNVAMKWVDMEAFQSHVTERLLSE